MSKRLSAPVIILMGSMLMAIALLACTVADQERIATTIAEDEEVQDRLIEAGNILETREAAYTPTPMAIAEIQATAVKATSVAEKFIEMTCDHWEAEAARMLESTEALVHNHQHGISSGNVVPPEWDGPDELECAVDHVATVAPHITATAALAGMIATAYAEDCGDFEDDEKPFECLMGWEYDPDRHGKQ